MSVKKVAIIGGGAAGLTTAVMLARVGIEVDVFEQNNKNGKKILVSGNGHCNITNRFVSANDYLCSDREFIKSVIARFDYTALERFLYSIGLLLMSKEDGRTYPLSYEAKGVVSAFENQLESLHVRHYQEHRVQEITKKNNLFSVQCDTKLYGGYDALVVASGSQAASKLGGNEDGYHFAKSFGHEIVKPYPVLVALHLKESFCASLHGVKVYTEVTLFVDNKEEQTVSGDTLFTKYGVSGLAILDISSTASLALLNHQKVELSINLLPQYNRQSLQNELIKLCKAVPNVSIFSVLSGIIAVKIVAQILKLENINLDTLAKQINKKQINRIVNILLYWRFEVVATRGFEYAEASGGGVGISQIDKKSLESKKCQGLYFAGEVLDVAGRRGGYNFHFAFASAYLVAEAIKNK